MMLEGAYFTKAGVTHSKAHATITRWLHVQLFKTDNSEKTESEKATAAPRVPTVSRNIVKKI